jgi:hypothetical protein
LTKPQESTEKWHHAALCLKTQNAWIRWVLFAGLAAFLPLFYFLAVIGGFLPYGGILLIGIRNLSNPGLVLFSLVHLVIYGFLLYWLARLIARLIDSLAGGYAWLGTAAVILLLAGLGAMPIYGIAHGQIHWLSAYQLYLSDTLR